MNDSVSESDLYHPYFFHEDVVAKGSLYTFAEWLNGAAFKSKDYRDKGVPIIKIAELKNGLSDQTKLADVAGNEKFLIEEGDLLFSWSGQPESSIDAFWFKEPKGILNQHIFKISPRQNVNPVYFFYLLKYIKPNFVDIARNKQTTGLGHVTKKDLRTIKIEIPNLSIQRKIVYILKSLDDKIELNQKMNETLEEIAKAIFKSWFIDFDPVRAKMDGLPTGLPEDISALFPDELVDSEIGEIPKGWEAKSLGDLVIPKRGKTITKKKTIEGDIPVVAGRT